MKKLLYLLTVTIFVSSISFASFPVKTSNQNEKQSKTTITISKKTTDGISIASKKNRNEKITTSSKAASKGSSKSKSSKDDLLILVLLWFFLGGLAAHRWYAGKPVGWNILFILTVGGCGIWAIIDLINILTGNF